MLMRVTIVELAIALAAIGALCLLALACWWSDHRARARELTTAQEIDQQRGAKGAGAR